MLDRPIRLLHIDDDVVVVDKPSSIPVHPMGTFNVSEVYDSKKFRESVS